MSRWNECLMNQPASLTFKAELISKWIALRGMDIVEVAAVATTTTTTYEYTYVCLFGVMFCCIRCSDCSASRIEPNARALANIGWMAMPSSNGGGSLKWQEHNMPTTLFSVGHRGLPLRPRWHAYVCVWPALAVSEWDSMHYAGIGRRFCSCVFIHVCSYKSFAYVRLGVCMCTLQYWILRIGLSNVWQCRKEVGPIALARNILLLRALYE